MALLRLLRIPPLRRLTRDDEGVALIEFAISLPFLLAVFAVVVEGARMMMGYQAAIAGVRDATRYMARLVSPTICATGGSVSGYESKLLSVARVGADTTNGLPNGVTIDSVTPSYSCVTGSFRGGQLPVAQVSAEVTFTFPFAGVIAWVGGSLPTMTRTVTDQQRVYGS